MADRPVAELPPRSLRSAAWRALVLAAIVAAAIAAFRWTPLSDLIERDRLAALLGQLRETVWAGPALVALYVVIAPLGIPITPLVFAGGAVFGLAVGWLLNLLGALLGAAITFVIGQRMGRDLVVHLVGAKKLQRTERALEQHGFWAIARIRFVPIPFALVNYGAALAGVRFGPFIAATAIGLAPSLIVYTTLSYALVAATAEDRMGVAIVGALALVGLLALTFIPTALRVLNNRKSDK